MAAAPQQDGENEQDGTNLADDGLAGAMATQPVRVRRVWYWRTRGQTLALLTLGLALVFYTSLGVAIFRGSAQLALILAGVDVLAGAALAAALSPVIMLRPDLVRIWHGFKFVNIGTSEIAGIGLLCTREDGPRPVIAWRLHIWRADGTGERTGYVYAPGLRRWRIPSNYDPLAASEIPALNASRAAKVGRDLDQRLLAMQGEGGPLATQRLERRSRAVRVGRYERVIGYWSPDGQAGRG